MQALIDLIRLHGTKMLGFLGVTLGVLAVADPTLVGGDRAIKYYLLGISLLNTWRGFFTSDAFKVGLVTKAETAAKANDILAANKQAGFFRLAMLVTLLIVGSIALPALMTGCTHTREAYKEAAAAPTPAQVVTDTAYVVAEQYSALVKQAADLKQSGTAPPSVILALQRIDQQANPAIHKMNDLRKVMQTGATAATQDELQAAVNAAVQIIADFSRQIAAARGGGQ